jgi:hypothetical protein
MFTFDFSDLAASIAGPLLPAMLETKARKWMLCG